MAFSFKRALIGRPIANQEAHEAKLGVFAGVPAMGLDGLGSAAYGPEAALSVLAVAGLAGLGAVLPIMGVIVLVLIVLYVSYRQTIAAYPNNGGSYTVAKENLGTNAGLVGAAALIIDYVLNAAVGISAGVAALSSAFPGLLHWTLPLCLGILALITLVNLRGTRESGIAFAVPTYLFVVSLGGVTLWGLAHWGAMQPIVAPPAPPHATEALTLWLVVRAFASGCSALTGVEAVANGVNSFREPRVVYAHRTLTVIAVILGALLLGIGVLAQRYGVTAMDQTQDGYQSVLSQLVAALVGRGVLYYVTIGSVLAVLCLSAQTSFTALPRLTRLLAVDGFLPRAFAVPGYRLVYWVGVLVLAGATSALLIAFGGITDRLIPLFAIGAFLSFTMSQAGMAAHWWRAMKDGGQVNATRFKLAVNGLGALTTGLALAVILVAKFTEGAWITVLILPVILLLLRATRHYYDRLDKLVLTGSHQQVSVQQHALPVVLIPIARWDQVARNAVQYAINLSPDVIGLHLTNTDGPDSTTDEESLQREWDSFVAAPARDAGLPAPALLIHVSPYRSVFSPLLREIQVIRRTYPGRPIMVVLPDLVEGHWWEKAMHRGRADRLRSRLLKQAGPGFAVASVPWSLDPPDIRQAIRAEEPVPAPN